MTSNRADAPAWFRDPGPGFRPATFWFWHRIPTQAEIVRQLVDMRDKGIGTVMIQARRALPLDAYLSPDYLDAYARACVEMRRLGLRIGIYDEYCWMSGHGGGRTVAGADHLRERHMFWARAAIGAGETALTVSNIRSPFHDFLGEPGATWCYEAGTAVWGEWECVAAFAHPRDIRWPQDVRDLPLDRVVVRAAGKAGAAITVDASARAGPGDEVTVFVAARCTTSRMINYLLPEAAARFAEKVYGPLLEAAGGSAHQVFFDHPYAGFYVWDERFGDLGNSLLWDAAIAPADPATLLSLVRDVGPATRSTRGAFLAGYQDRMHRAFFGTLSTWCAEKGVAFSGHELLTHVGAWGLQAGLGGIDPRSMPGVDHFGVDAYRTITAVDAADYQPQLSAKLGDSVARANGRKRCTIEQYSTGRETGMPGLAGQWGLTAERFRAQAIRHLLSGARQILLHAVNVTDGRDDDPTPLVNPRFDFPPAFNFEPWWEDCPALFSELSRLSGFLEDGEPLRPVALYYPLETIRAEAVAPPCSEHFGWWAEALFSAGLGYDIVDERGLVERLSPKTGYETLILPAVSTIASLATLTAIAAFVDRGGRVLISGEPPSYVRDADDEARSGADPGEFLRKDTVRWLQDADRDSVAAAVHGLPRPRPDARFENGPTVSAIARCDKGWRIAVFNDQPSPRALNLTVSAQDAQVTVWHADTGQITNVSGLPEGRARIEIGAHRLVCLSVGAGAATPVGAVASAVREAAVSEEHVTLADGWTLQIGDAPPRPVEVDRGWQAQGWPAFSGTGVYRRSVRPDELPTGRLLRLLLPEAAGTMELRVDGVPVGRRIAGEALFDLPAGSGEIELELHVRNTGANRYYAGTPFQRALEPSGLVRPPVLVGCDTADDLAVLRLLPG